MFQLRGEMEMDAEYFKMGVALKTMAHMETPLSLTASANLPKAKFYTKFNVEKLVSVPIDSLCTVIICNTNK